MAKGDTRTVEKDLRKINEVPEHYRDGSVGVATPMDVPCYVRVHQILEATENHKPERRSFSEGVKANVVSLDLWTYGVKVLVRMEGYGPDSVLKVFIEDSDGVDKVAEYEKGE